MRIQHNIMAMNAYRNYTNNVSAMKKNLEKLSSGYKINRAGDDAAGLAISEKMRAQITGLQQAQNNAKSGINLVQTAEGALTEVHDMLNRMVKLADQSANGTYDVDTDRNQMQKEINQLLDEINRIADSSNFNGINLLDGTLGLNTKAFKVEALDAVKASNGKLDISDLVAAASDGSPAVHLETSSVTAATPAASINLGNLKVTLAGSTDEATMDFSIAGNTYTVSFTATGANTTFDASDIAAKLSSEMASVKVADGTSAAASDGGNGAVFGDAAFQLGDGTSGVITLTYKGRGVSGTYATEASFAGSASEATAINSALGFSVTVGELKGDDGNEGAVTKTGDVIHKATKVDQATAKVDAGLAGIDIKLTSDLVVEGGTLTIDGKTFTFVTDADSTLTTGSGTYIDVSKYATKDEQIHAAADLLSKQTVAGQEDRTWAIGVQGDGTVIHIDQTAASKTGKELKKYDDLVKLIEAKGKSADAENAGSKLTITDSAVKEGNVVTINGKKYEFTDDAEKLAKTGGDITYVAIDGGAGQNLATALGDAATYVEKDNTITVRAAKATDPAPKILGKGLTLQIGDTSDSFNQLNVAVQDMHTTTLGINKLDISTEEAAQIAIDKIKAAINTVSDVRGTLGATQNRLDHTINNLSVMTENIQDAESTIRDTDVADEMMAYTKNNILIQSAQAMLAQANQVPQGVLQLLS